MRWVVVIHVKQSYEFSKTARIGTFGTLGVVLALAIRCSLLLEIDHVKGWILGQSLSRVAPWPCWAFYLMLIEQMEHQNPEMSLVLGRSKQELFVFFGVCISVASIYAQWMSAAHVILLWFLVIAISSCILGWRFMKRADGLTGDFLGATQQITEVIILCVMVQ